MTLDTTQFPMLGDPEHPPMCSHCGEPLNRIDSLGYWVCRNWLAAVIEDGPICPIPTDAELDDRMQTLAEDAEERRLARG